jgi:hypothetical protein
VAAAPAPSAVPPQLHQVIPSALLISFPLFLAFLLHESEDLLFSHCPSSKVADTSTGCLCFCFVCHVVQHLRVCMLTHVVWSDLCAGMARAERQRKEAVEKVGQTKHMTKQTLTGGRRGWFCASHVMSTCHINSILIKFTFLWNGFISLLPKKNVLWFLNNGAVIISDKLCAGDVFHDLVRCCPTTCGSCRCTRKSGRCGRGPSGGVTALPTQHGNRWDATTSLICSVCLYVVHRGEFSVIVYVLVMVM